MSAPALPDALADRGWLCFPADPRIARWVRAIRPHADAAVADPANAHWLRYQGTWFAGVNVLDNDASGQIGTSGPLQGAVIEKIAARGLPTHSWDRAQISVTYPGYPRSQPGESEAARRYRRTRCAAHLDGLLPIGPTRRRMLRERHAFILGLPLTETGPGASPMVVWQGSSQIMRAALAEVLLPYPPETWAEIDLTEAYHAARRRCFETCECVALHANPGQAYLLHRLALHGVAPWQPGAVAPAEGRMIAYFRPDLPGTGPDWLTAP